MQIFALVVDAVAPLALGLALLEGGSLEDFLELFDFVFQRLVLNFDFFVDQHSYFPKF